MSAQPPATDNGASRKRSHDMAIADETGQTNRGEPNCAQEPRLVGDGRNFMGQLPPPNMNAFQVVQGSAPFGQLSQAHASAQNGGSAPAASSNLASTATVQVNQTTGTLLNNMMVQPQQYAGATDASAQSQADVAALVRQALMMHAQADAQSNQGAPSSAPTVFTLPNAASVQANQASASFPLNNMLYHNQNQSHVAAPFAAQLQQPTLLHAQHQGVSVPTLPQLHPFGMDPQQLLNYAVMVNILHNSTSQGNSNQLPSLVSNVQQLSNQGALNQAAQPAQQAVMNGIPSLSGLPNQFPPAAASLPQESSQIMQSNGLSNGLALNQASVANRDAQCSSLSSYQHAVSPSIPSESNFNTNTGRAPLPPHVIEAKKVDPQSRCVPLWTDQDEQRLSTQQCWLRKQIETFPASQKDVRRHTRGRNRILKLGQVGIQCIHCKNLPQEGRGKGSSYFLSSTKGIYQAAQNILAYHFKEDTCPIISQKLLQEMRDAGSSGCPRHLAPKAGKSRSGGGKSFWEEAATNVTGLIDTTVGIRYNDDRNSNYLPLESVSLGLTESALNGVNYCSSESVLVSPGDKDAVTSFCFLLMSQFVPYADESRKSATECDSDLDDDDDSPRAGVVCRFCKGVSVEGKHRDGVFLSIKPSTMMRNKQLMKLHNHVVSCRYVPEDLKMAIVNAKEMHLPQSDQLKRGWKKVFFENVCERLKQALDAAGNASGGETRN